ncbi:MAG TPA: sialate O-acetylesterase [Prolixibacteraceae bacterium]|nr:sialate O-acetylesterase [Prolixibacteraceae bacterium]
MKKLFFLALICLAISLHAEVKLPRIFTDHAVFQRQKPIPVWGWAKPGEPVTVGIGTKTMVAKADKQGNWKVNLPAMEAGGPYTLTVKSKSNTIELKDILVGEVWLCSGQSNMEWKVNSAKDALQEKSAANYPMIRHFQVEKGLAFEPQNDLPSGNWVVCTPESVGDFTAVGYFFAREVLEKTKVPVGLIHSSWGGSQVEGWISREGYEKSAELQACLKTMPKNWKEADSVTDRKLKVQLFGTPDPKITREMEENYRSPGTDYSGWWNGYAPGGWDWQGIWAFRGQGYSMCTVNIPKEVTTMETFIGLGSNDSYMKVYINGTEVWSGEQAGRHIFAVPPLTWRAGKNILLLKYGPVKNPDWFGMGLSGPAEDLFIKTKDLSFNLPLSGNIWKLMPSIAEYHTYVHLMNNVGITLYNAMIHPLTRYAIRGALWYQGEANTGRAYQYRTTFPDLINDWRAKWGEEFPFYFVQLSSYGPNQSSNEGSDWAELREAQTMTLKLPHTGMAVTTDIGNPNDIHPTNKQDVGKRLAAIALNELYGIKSIYLNPMFESLKVQGNQAILTIRNCGTGLKALDKFGYVRGFEIAGADKKFRYAQAQISGSNIVVYHPEVSQPVAVRYGWSNAPVDANVFSSDGLPLSPFRTDDWPGITAGKKFE